MGKQAADIFAKLRSKESLVRGKAVALEVGIHTLPRPISWRVCPVISSERVGVMGDVVLRAPRADVSKLLQHGKLLQSLRHRLSGHGNQI